METRKAEMAAAQGWGEHSQMLSNAENISTLGGPGTARPQAQNRRTLVMRVPF
jgi:hypothetical protein